MKVLLKNCTLLLLFIPFSTKAQKIFADNTDPFTNVRMVSICTNLLNLHYGN